MWNGGTDGAYFLSAMKRSMGCAISAFRAADPLVLEPSGKNIQEVLSDNLIFAMPFPKTYKESSHEL